MVTAPHAAAEGSANLSRPLTNTVRTPTAQKLFGELRARPLLEAETAFEGRPVSWVGGWLHACLAGYMVVCLYGCLVDWRGTCLAGLA
jgi:hypothetical protein